MAKISVIIPVYNEAGHIGELLRYLKSIIPDDRAPRIDLLVVDGGSTDTTAEEVLAEGVRLVKSPLKGRSAQMNYGAKESSGEVLYFLHADSFPPSDIFSSVVSKVRAGAEAGCSRLRFDSERWLMRLYAWFTRFDLLPFRFGDQGLFVRRDVFEELGGFREDLVVMEDNEMMRLLRKRGRFVVMENYVTTSARKYQENGFVRLQFIFSMIFIFHYLGASQKMLVQFYRDMVKGTKI
ncbi:MAG: TIGR04283 family arsenosugar biosynthesis glycosyltransferase [Balneolia bacterium]|nr:TIGR04283 family arsenosugar biosynthesis glycosyltransferase [Balneolia bacterium]